MATTYCLQANVESLLSSQGVLRRIDDDEGGTASAAETAYVTDAIERGAVRMNMYLDRRYTLSDLASNDWCKWCNAVLAAVYVCERKGNPVPASIVREYNEHIDLLREIGEGKLRVPEQSDSFDAAGPRVINFVVEPDKRVAPVRVDPVVSTTPAPASGRVYNPTTRQHGDYQ